MRPRQALRGGHAAEPGAAVYTGTCANCHGLDGKGFTPYIPALAGNPILLDNDPSSLINLVLNGSNPLVVKGTPDAYRMPQFRLQFSDQEIADVVTFIRNGWGNAGAGGHGRASRRTAQDDRPDQRPGHHPENALAEETYLPSRQMPSASCAGRSEIENSTNSFAALCE